MPNNNNSSSSQENSLTDDDASLNILSSDPDTYSWLEQLGKQELQENPRDLSLFDSHSDEDILQPPRLYKTSTHTLVMDLHALLQDDDFSEDYKSEQVKLWINQQLSVNTSDDDGTTPLMIAAEKGYIGIMLQLLQAGAHVNAQDVDGRSVLHEAVYGGHINAVYLLLAYGADIMATSHDEGNVCDFARTRAEEKISGTGHHMIVSILDGYIYNDPITHANINAFRNIQNQELPLFVRSQYLSNHTHEQSNATSDDELEAAMTLFLGNMGSNNALYDENAALQEAIRLSIGDQVSPCSSSLYSARPSCSSSSTAYVDATENTGSPTQSPPR